LAKKQPVRFYRFAEKIANEKTITLIAALSEPDVLKKVPADAKEDWVGLVETLPKC
jgi:hypothetical protein